jgi:hypothetical protein
MKKIPVAAENHRIYELKPYNPWSIRRGIRQLDTYKKVIESSDPLKLTWETIIELY